MVQKLKDFGFRNIIMTTITGLLLAASVGVWGVFIQQRDIKFEMKYMRKSFDQLESKMNSVDIRVQQNKNDIIRHETLLIK